MEDGWILTKQLTRLRLSPSQTYTVSYLPCRAAGFPTRLEPKLLRAVI